MMFTLRRLRKTTTLKHIRLYHSVNLFNPSTHLQEQEHQACYLTKTLVQHQLPPPVVDVPLGEREQIHEAVKQCIINTNHFYLEDKPELKKRWRDKRKKATMRWWRHGFSEQLMLNMLRAIESVPSATNIGPRGTTRGMAITAPWERLGKKIQVCGRHGNLTSGKRMLPLLAAENEIEATRDIDITWNDLISPFFDLHETQLDKFVAESGFHPGSPYPCPHTLMAVNPLWWKSHFNTGQGIFFAFAHAMNHALSRGEQMGTDLEHPVPVQCILFNGLSFDFVCYQLNTLDFDNDTSGRKNMAWISNEPLYEAVNEQSAFVDKPYDAPKVLSSPLPSLPLDDDMVELRSKRVSLWDYDRRVLSRTLTNEKCTRICVDGYNRDAVDVLTDFMFRSCAGTVGQIEGDGEAVVEQLSASA